MQSCPISPMPTFRFVVAEYLVDIQCRVDAKLIGERYRWQLHRYCTIAAAYFGDRPAAEITRADLARWVTAHREWVSPHTRSDACRSVISCLRWAFETRLIPQAPPRSPTLGPQQLAPRPAITPLEVARIMKAVRTSNGITRRRKPSRQPFKYALLFLWLTGARTCEMRECRWEHVDWDRGVISLTRHKTDRTGKPRLIPLTDKMLRLLLWMWKRKRPDCPWIFPNSRGGQWRTQTFADMFRSYARQSGVRDEVSAYCLRHGFTVRALDLGIGERQIADVLGHTSTKWVGWYGQSTRLHAGYLRKILGQVRPD